MVPNVVGYLKESSQNQRTKANDKFWENPIRSGSFSLFRRTGRNKQLVDADHERDTDQTNPTRAQQATYPTNKQDKEEVACVGLSRSLEQSLQHVGVHYPAER
ncbi:uncharacterized protein TNCV_4880791 [Trichonephila clavipes]|nr:uncharacterized protein TNCV_4880791 [Trichonephila clavipes]